LYSVLKCANLVLAPQTFYFYNNTLPISLLIVVLQLAES